MKKYAILIVALLSTHVWAEDVTITTGRKGLTYNDVYGLNLATVLNEFGHKTTLLPSKGSLENADRVASGEAQIGFVQADAYQFWRGKNGNAAQHTDIAGELSKECVFVTVKENGKIDGNGDIKEGIKVAVGEPTSGSYATWSYLQTLISDYAKAETYAKGGNRTLAKVKTGEIDAFLWVAAKDKSNDYLDIVMQPDSGLKLIDMTSWHVNDKLPNGKAVYTKEESKVKGGFFSKSIDTPCTTTLVITNNEASDELLDEVSTIMLKNSSRITSSGK